MSEIIKVKDSGRLTLGSDGKLRVRLNDRLAFGNGGLLLTVNQTLGWSLGATAPSVIISGISSTWGSYAYAAGFTKVYTKVESIFIAAGGSGASNGSWGTSGGGGAGAAGESGASNGAITVAHVSNNGTSPYTSEPTIVATSGTLGTAVLIPNVDLIETDDSVANSVTGNITLRSKATLNSWTPTVANTLNNKDSTVAGGRSDSFTVQPSGVLRFTFSTNGTAVTDVDSTVATGFADGSTNWCAVERNPTTGDVRFYISADGITWTQLGATVTAATGAIYNSTTKLRFGNLSSASMVFAGKMFVNQVWSGFAVSDPGAAVKKAEFNASDYRSGKSHQSLTTGELWIHYGSSVKLTNNGTITIGFTSDVPAFSKIEYGVSPGVYLWTVNDLVSRSDHSIILGESGEINRARVWYYRIGVSTNGGASWSYSAEQTVNPPQPDAHIGTEIETISPNYITSTTYGYVPTVNTQNGYAGLKTYEGYAPHPVFFLGQNNSNPDAVVSTEWDFGAGTESDYGGRTASWVNGSHVFETPGIYPVTHRTTDILGRTSTETVTVTVHAAGAGNTSMNIGTLNAPGTGTYALRTFFVDPVNGLDTYTGQAQVWDGVSSTSDGPWQTFEKVLAMLRKSGTTTVNTWGLRPGDQVLFKRGTTINVPTGAGSYGHGGLCQGVHLGAYGTGANPLVAWTGTVSPNTYNFLLDCYGKGASWLKITDIDFNLKSASHTLQGIFYGLLGSREFLLLRSNTINSLNAAVNVGEPAAKYFNDEFSGVHILGCTASHVDNVSTAVILLYYGSASRLSLHNTEADLAGNHTNYIQNPHGFSVIGNVFSRPAYGRTALRVTGGPTNSPAERGYIAGNMLLGHKDPLTVGSAHNGGGVRYNYQLSNLSHNSNSLFDENIRDIIFERNIFTNMEGGLTITNLKRAKIRRNIFVSPNTGENISFMIRIGDASAYQKYGSEDVEIDNNTFIYNGPPDAIYKKYFIQINAGGGIGLHPGLKIRNNLFFSTPGRKDIPLYFVDNNAAQLADIVCDNNLYDSDYGTWAEIAGTEYSLAAWQALHGKDINSLKTSAGFVAAPTAVTHASGYPNSKAACIAEADAYVAALRLAAGSAAINAGSDDVLVYRDYDGNPVPVGAHTDIGAFEGPGGGSVISLPQQANLVAQWSADSISQANGSSIASWADSISGIVASQATGANQPTFQTNIYGGKPSVRFNGSSHKLDIATPGALKTAVDSQTFTVMIAFKQLSNTGGGYGSLLTYKDGVAATRYYIADNSRLHRYPMKSNGASIPFGATYLNTFATFGNTSGNGPRGAGLERAYVNGGCVYAETSKAPGGNTSQWMIGSNVGGTFYVNADIFEILVWNVELTPAEVKQYQSWVCNKYSQTVPWAGLTYYTVFDGDSLTMGSGETGSVSGIYPYKSAASLGLTYGQWDNLGIGSQLISEMTTKFSTDVSPIATQTGKPLKIAAFEWYNQKGTPDPVANALAYLSTARAAGAKVAFGTSTDSSLTPETERANYNAYFDANHSAATMDAYAPIHNNANIGVEGATTAHPTYFNADKIHLVALGYTELASYMTTALSAIP